MKPHLAAPPILGAAVAAPGQSAPEPRTLTVAALSLTPEPWAKLANLAKLERFTRQAAARGAQVVVAPEGYLPEAARILAINGADIIFVPAWGGYGEMNDLTMRVRAYENGAYLAFVHPKRALLIDASGAIIAQNQGERGQMVAGTFTVPSRRKHSLLQYRRPELYQDLIRR